MRSLLLALIMILWLAGSLASAQSADQAVLIADTVEIDAKGNLVASGVVEVMYKGNTLLADKIIYNRTTDKIDILGPITLSEPNGNVVNATEGSLDRDLRNGILKSAKLVLDQQIELNAAELARVEGRYSDMNNVGATSCKTCNNAPPLWQIRAKTVRHDEVEKQIYFRHAQFRIYDVPVFYMPYLRMPDPTVKRYRGFLRPKGQSSSILGLGIKLPYFIPIGEDKDLTLTPFISTKTTTLEWRYRQAFVKGNLEVTGSMSQDLINSGKLRGYARAEGKFKLPLSYKLAFDLEMVSDDSYLGDYDIDTKDRLESIVTVSKADKRSYRALNVISYHSFYDNNGTLPTLVTFNEFEKRFLPSYIGGELRLNIQAHSNFRRSNEDGVGRDMARLNGSLLYRRTLTDRFGIQWGFGGQGRYDYFATKQDSSYPKSQTAFTADSFVEARLPLVRHYQNGSTLIEPMVQIGYSERQVLDLPNEESTRVELDSANLLSLSRFPSPDRYERGLRGAWGLRLSHRLEKNKRLGFVIGRVYRETARDDFSLSSGLRNTKSDYLLSASYYSSKSLQFMGRAIVSEDTEVTKAEALLKYKRKKLNLSAGYSLLKADAYEERVDNIAEWKLSSNYALNENWTLSNSLLYDLVSDKTAQAGLGLKYQNECVDIDFSVSRRFTATGTSKPSTTYEMTVDLLGFSTGGRSGVVTRSCKE